MILSDPQQWLLRIHPDGCDIMEHRAFFFSNSSRIPKIHVFSDGQKTVYAGIARRSDIIRKGTDPTNDRILEIYDQMHRARRTGTEWQRPLGTPADETGNFLLFEEWKDTIPEQERPEYRNT